MLKIYVWLTLFIYLGYNIDYKPTVIYTYKNVYAYIVIKNKSLFIFLRHSLVKKTHIVVLNLSCLKEFTCFVQAYILETNNNKTL